ncbi:piggyBac transposable element-derived protein 4-like [Saccostrea cucullata]|uniref:piggyBac transposable element-derived protein 4-like n=1 Tax=Saccostrea cuccullata TaxID=36930 RepID=UPI002ED5D6DA
MVPWQGNLSFRVYNPDKPKKYGIKAYMFCDAVTGYCLRLKLYPGKSETPASANGATYDLVMDMMRGYFGQGYILYMDNYYSSPQLYTDLFVLGCGATGTLRVNRKGIPQRIKDKKYHDRKVVYLLSTIEEAAKAPCGRVAPRTGTPIENPAIVNVYNKYMGGIDRSDQMVSYATFNARTLKWWKRVIFHVISLATLNAYLCYKTLTPRKPMLHRVFRKQLVTELVQSVNRACVPGMSTKPVGRPSTAAEPIMRLQGQHFPMKIVGTGIKKNITRACVVCSVAERQRLESIGEKRKRAGKESSYQCDKCLSALCVDPCFKLFHTHKDYIAAYKTRVMVNK